MGGWIRFDKLLSGEIKLWVVRWDRGCVVELVRGKFCVDR